MRNCWEKLEVTGTLGGLHSCSDLAVSGCKMELVPCRVWLCLSMCLGLWEGGHSRVLSMPLELHPDLVLGKPQSREGWGHSETVSLPHHPWVPSFVVTPHWQLKRPHSWVPRAVSLPLQS